MTGFTIVSVDSDLPVLRAAAGLPEIGAGTELDPHFSLGRGAFAEVISVTMPGTTVALALKRFSPGVSDTARTGELIAELHRRLSTLPPSVWLRSCAGVPLWFGQISEDGGAPLPALLSFDLRAVGYVSLEEILDDGCAGLLSMDLGDRIELARSFAEGAAVFEDLGLLHSDINPPNLFVDLDNRRVALIDVDGGALAGVGDGIPEACGKADDFLAPELADQTSAAGVSVSSERWSYGITVSYLLLGTHPLYFLRSLGGKVIDEYQHSFVWPDVDLASDLVSDGAAIDYPAWKADVDQLPSEITNQVRNLLAGHADPSLRPSAWSWALALQPGPPWFEVISAATTVTAGRDVEVTWWAPRASTVTVAGVTGLPARGSALIPVAASGPIRLEAANSYGTAEGWTDPVAVFRGPPSPILRVPRFMPSALPRIRLPAPLLLTGSQPWRQS